MAGKDYMAKLPKLSDPRLAQNQTVNIPGFGSVKTQNAPEELQTPDHQALRKGSKPLDPNIMADPRQAAFEKALSRKK